MYSDLQTTQLLSRLRNGDSSASQELLPLVYDELRSLAECYMSRERLNHTLQPTALVHEAYLRLVKSQDFNCQGRAQFMALAAAQIRKILVDHARRHRAAKRGGGAPNSALNDTPAPSSTSDVDLLDLDHALTELAERSPRQSRVVELRFFGGLSVEDVAGVLHVSQGTVKGDWRAARAWLQQRMNS